MRYIRFGKKIIKCALTFIVGGLKKKSSSLLRFRIIFPTISTRDGINK